ncbi:MAG TPA: hypothetical protein VIK01_05435 [Polyangiaceae bacterium]
MVSISVADRDLTRFVIPDGGAFQDFALILFPGNLRIASRQARFDAEGCDATRLAA